MFTGIITHTAPVLSNPGSELVIKNPWVSDPTVHLVLGESIAINGVCLTLTQAPAQKDSAPLKELKFFVSTETLACSQLGSLAPGSIVNLERALRVGDSLSGHWVQGHVDEVGKIVEIAQDSGSHRMRVSCSAEFAPLLVHKGSITVNGISLTLNRVSPPSPKVPGWFELMIIPHTWEHTHLKNARVGDPVNLEADVLARHLERRMSFLNGATPHA
jgi:riboflavin synthase